MAFQTLSIVKNWFTGNTCVESNWDNLRTPLVTWAETTVNDLNQIRVDTHGATYSVDNDGLPNLPAPLRQWDTGLSNVPWNFSNIVAFSGLVGIADSAGDHYYVLGRADLGSDRTISLPLLTGDDTFVFANHLQTLTNKTLTSPTVNSPDINGGTWNGTIDGGWTAAGQTCTNLGTVTTADINGGSIDGTAVGGAVPAAGSFTSLNATGGGSLTGTWSNLGTVTTVDINGGTVDGAVVGGASPAAGTFTTLGATTGNITTLNTTTGNITTVNASSVYGVPQICSKTIILPEFVRNETDDVPLLPIETSWAPNGIEIIECGIKINTAQIYSVAFQMWDTPTTSHSTISTVACAVSETEKTSGAISFTAAAGNIIFADLPNTTGLKWLQVWFVYKVKAS